LPGGQLRWRLLAPDGAASRRGIAASAALLPGSNLQEIASIHFAAPEVDTGQKYTLVVELDRDIANSWPLWIYPAVNQWPDVLVLYDPAGCFWMGWTAWPTRPATPVVAISRCAEGQILITSLFTEVTITFGTKGQPFSCRPAESGFPVALPVLARSHQAAVSPPAHRRIPARRIHRFAVLPSGNRLRAGHDSGCRPKTGHHPLVTPLICRLDARLFTVLDYLVELSIGSGRLLASTLRFAAARAIRWPG
jgi:hypothetical protein